MAPARRAMERIPSAQPPPACLPKAPGLEPGDLPGMDFAHMYQVYKSRRGIKRSEDSKVRIPRPSGPQPLARAVLRKVFSL